MIGDNSKTVVLWGLGIDLDSFLYRNAEFITYIVDRDPEKQGRTITAGKRSWTVLSPDDVIGEDYFFVIGTGRLNFLAIKDVLENNGKRYLDDFCEKELFRKKLVMLHGNCHMEVLKELLRLNKDFALEYGVYELPLIQNLKEPIDEHVLGKCDVFIHQDIRETNAVGNEYSDKHLLPKLNDDSINITVPNLFGFGDMFFPFFMWNKHNPKCVNDNNGMFPHSDKVLNSCFENGMGYEDIARIMSANPYSETEIVDNFNRRIEALRTREENWDFPMSQFILENYKDRKLFYDQGHPTNFVMNYIANKVLGILGLRSDESQDRLAGIDEMDGNETFVYPCVMQALEMEWDNTEIRRFSDRKKNRMDFNNFVKEFVEWCI